MSKYVVDYTYNVPEWGDIELEAEDEEEAEEQALDWAKRVMPEEAIDLEIIDVKELDG